MPEGKDEPRKKIKITDPRKTTAFGEPIQKGRTGEYPEEVIRHIVLAADRLGVDPLTMVAKAMQESGLGTYEKKGDNDPYANPSQIRWDLHKNDKGMRDAIMKNKDLNSATVAMAY